MADEARPSFATGDAGARPDEVAELVGRLAGDEPMDRETRVRLLGKLAKAMAGAGRRARAAGGAGGAWLTDVLVDVAPRIPVRDMDMLRAHHKGLAGDALADSLSRTAANATTAVGAAGGALAAVEFAAPPLLLSTPAQLAAETLVVAAIEVKLIAEMHEVYGVQVPGGAKSRAAAFLTGWARQRGIDPLNPATLNLAMGAAARAAVRKRLVRTFGRHLTTLGPLLTGAVAGGALNRAATHRLARAIRKDLERQLGRPGYPALAIEAPGGQA